MFLLEIYAGMQPICFSPICIDIPCSKIYTGELAIGKSMYIHFSAIHVWQQLLNYLSVNLFDVVEKGEPEI